MKHMHIILTLLLCAIVTGVAQAKLPPPSEEAKAKAEEAKAKAAHGDKVSAYQLCKSQDKVAERYQKNQKGKGAKPAASTCQDPGPFQMVASAPAAAPAPAPAPAPAKKK
ncbi:MAG: hypothetical protein AAB319_05575 [Pseudomonadota bacterium]